MPGPIAVLEDGTVECKLCGDTLKAENPDHGDNVANEHLDEKHPEVADD